MILAVSLALGPARLAFAWGRMAHRASAKLAESRLTPRTLERVRLLLEPGESLADASTWADENSREIPGSASWHYVNVPITHERYSARDCRKSGCVVSKLEEFRAILADPRSSRGDQRAALRFVIHFVQDLHQPMHVADHDDRGGNALQLRLGRNDATNLHQVWDSGLLRTQFRHEDDLVRALRELAAQPEARRWHGQNVEDWANESFTLGRTAYRDPETGALLRNGSAISRAYERVNTPRAALRLAQAGVRLADVLNEALGDRPGQQSPTRGSR